MMMRRGRGTWIWRARRASEGLRVQLGMPWMRMRRRMGMMISLKSCETLPPASPGVRACAITRHASASSCLHWDERPQKPPLPRFLPIWGAQQQDTCMHFGKFRRLSQCLASKMGFQHRTITQSSKYCSTLQALASCGKGGGRAKRTLS